jgi:hypothetical protein
MQFLFTEWQCNVKDGRIGKFHKADQNLSYQKYGAVWWEDAQNYNMLIRNYKCDRSGKSATLFAKSYLLSQPRQSTVGLADYIIMTCVTACYQLVELADYIITTCVTACYQLLQHGRVGRLHQHDLCDSVLSTAAARWSWQIMSSWSVWQRVINSYWSLCFYKAW